MRFIGGVNQLHAIALVKGPRLMVIDVGEEGEMGLRIDRRRYGDRLAGAALPGVEARFVQHFSRFTTQLVEQTVGDKQWRQVDLHVAWVVNGLPQFCDAVTQIGQRFFCLIGFGERSVESMGHADAIFTGHGQNQLFLPAAQRNVHGDAAFAGSLQKRLLPVVIEVTVERLVRTRFVQIRRHLVRPHPIAIFAGFLHRIGTEAHHFTLDHHVKAIAVG